jgi:predicted RNA binding protein YcfA (HicA-like mRNA interferase family)
VGVWGSRKAKVVYRALLGIGWQVVSQAGSHIKLRHQAGKFPDYIWAFHDSDELGPKMLTRIAKHTGLKPEDL